METRKRGSEGTTVVGNVQLQINNIQFKKYKKNVTKQYRFLVDLKI